MKLTAVTAYARGVKVQGFFNLPVGEDGRVRVPSWVIDRMFARVGILLMRGDTVSVGV